MALRDSMRNPAAWPTDAIILRQRRAWASSPFVLALVAFIPALAGGLVQRQLLAVVIFGALAALTIWLWVLVIRRCGRLNVAADAITFVKREASRTSRLSAIRGMSRCRHAYRVDWFRRRQRQNSVSCSARALPWL